jgi:hypothetical protein
MQKAYSRGRPQKKVGKRGGFERAVGARMLLGDDVPVTRSAISIVACIRGKFLRCNN